MAEKILSIPVSCFKCGRRSCVRSSRKTLKRAFMRMLGWHLWQCTACGTRFYLRRKGYEAHIGGGQTVKQDSDKRQREIGSPKDKAI